MGVDARIELKHVSGNTGARRITKRLPGFPKYVIAYKLCALCD
jgi:hypothetical protein